MGQTERSVATLKIKKLQWCSFIYYECIYACRAVLYLVFNFYDLVDSTTCNNILRPGCNILVGNLNAEGLLFAPMIMVSN